MPDPNPLLALRKATSMSSGDPKPSQVKMGMMPSPPWGSISSLASPAIQAIEDSPIAQALPSASDVEGMLGSIKSGIGRIPGGIRNMASGAVQGLEEAFPGGASTGPEVYAAKDLSNPAVAQNMENMYQSANPTFRGLEDSGMFQGDRTTGAMKGLQEFSPSTINPLGSSNPEFTPVGGENLFNTSQPKPLVPPIPDARASAIQSILARGGR